MFKKYNIARNRGYLKYSISEHFAQNKWAYLIFGLIVLVGLIIGFIVGFNRAENFSLSDLPDATLACLIGKKTSAASMFFSRLFAFLGLCFLLFCVNSKCYLCWIAFFIFLYRSFLFGLNCAILISLYKFGGVVNVVLIYFPVHLISLFLLMCVGVVCFACCVNQKNIGYSVFSGNFLRENKGLLLVMICTTIICYLVECIVVPHITSVLFVGIS